MSPLQWRPTCPGTRDRIEIELRIVDELLILNHVDGRDTIDRSELGTGPDPLSKWSSK